MRRSAFDVTKLTVDVPAPGGGSATSSSSSSASQEPPPGPSRWRSKEFCVYYALFLLVVPRMAKATVDLSKGACSSSIVLELELTLVHSVASQLSFLLASTGAWVALWLACRTSERRVTVTTELTMPAQDVSDHQWNTFRGNVPVLLALVALWMGCRAAYLAMRSSRLAPDALVRSRTRFVLACTIPLLVVFHGASVFKIFLLLALNFAVAQLASARDERLRRVAPLATWALNLGVLFANELCDGYKFQHLHPSLAALDAEWASGRLPRWHISWNITMLRLVSFNLDYYWAVRGERSERASSRSTSRSLDLQEYTFANYVAYALYPPLYVAGPIITFNAFQRQTREWATEKTDEQARRRMLVSYAVRWVACALTMEVILHSMYVVAIKDSARDRHGAWANDTPFELSMIGFWNLIVVWLKLLIPWRFFRLWALLDGIDPPENMVRCMANNYSTLGFWRSWHRSYNLWVVRYLYVPLGGSSNAFLSTLVVFTFVALWHDLSLKLLAWGWVITLFIGPEMLARRLVPASKYATAWWYHYLASVGGVANIIMMMTANLIGFALGTDGTAYMWRQIIGTSAGIRFMVVATICLYIAVQIMFEYRCVRLQYCAFCG